jgi:hypothetical protein
MALDVDDGDWAILLITDPSLPADHQAGAMGYEAFGRALAYTSPFSLETP